MNSQFPVHTIYKSYRFKSLNPNTKDFDFHTWSDLVRKQMLATFKNTNKKPKSPDNN
jgi:hypothetical protein